MKVRVTLFQKDNLPRIKIYTSCPFYIPDFCTIENKECDYFNDGNEDCPLRKEGNVSMELVDE